MPVNGAKETKRLGRQAVFAAGLAMERIEGLQGFQAIRIFDLHAGLFGFAESSPQSAFKAVKQGLFTRGKVKGVAVERERRLDVLGKGFDSAAFPVFPPAHFSQFNEFLEEGAKWQRFGDERLADIGEWERNTSAACKGASHVHDREERQEANVGCGRLAACAAFFGGKEVTGAKIVGFMEDFGPGAGVKESSIGVGEHQLIPAGVLQWVYLAKAG